MDKLQLGLKLFLHFDLETSLICTCTSKSAERQERKSCQSLQPTAAVGLLETLFLMILCGRTKVFSGQMSDLRILSLAENGISI